MARGSVRPIQRRGKDGKAYQVWRARVPAGETPDGRRRQLTTHHRTRREADAWVAAQLTRTANGESAAGDVLTVGDLLDRWLALHARDVSAATSRVDAWGAGVVRRELGTAKIQKLTPLRLQAFYDGLDARLSPGSIKTVHRVLRSALDLAVAWELLGRNPAKATKRPGVVPPAKTVWTVAQAQRFLDATADDFDGPLFALLLSTGIRIGEAIALDWRHVDLAAGTLAIERTMTYAAKSAVVVGTKAKSRTSHRRIVLPLPAQVALKRQRERQEARRATTHRDEWRESGAVFDRGDGVRRAADTVRHRLRQINETLGLPHLTPHGMRHFTATTLFARKVSPKLIQDLLGHATLAVTMDVYSHVMDTDRSEVARAMEAALGGVDVREERQDGLA